MASISITAVDISKVTGYTRNQVRGLLDKLPRYAEQDAAPGVAREYTRSDLLVLAVIHHLEARVRVHRDALAAIVEPLRNELSGPKTINEGARLLISFDPPTASYLATANTPIQEGIVIALGPIFERVDGHLTKKFENPYLAPTKHPELNFGPMLISHGKKKAVG